MKQNFSGKKNQNEGEKESQKNWREKEKKKMEERVLHCSKKWNSLYWNPICIVKRYRSLFTISFKQIEPPIAKKRRPFIEFFISNQREEGRQRKSLHPPSLSLKEKNMK